MHIEIGSNQELAYDAEQKNWIVVDEIMMHYTPSQLITLIAVSRLAELALYL